MEQIIEEDSELLWIWANSGDFKCCV